MQNGTKGDVLIESAAVDIPVRLIAILRLEGLPPG